MAKLLWTLILAAGLAIGMVGCLSPKPNRPPVAAFTVTLARGYVPLAVAFDASGSTDPERATLEYAWFFGDGTEVAGESPTHTYGEPGSYEVTLRITDPGGLQGTVSKRIDVLAVPDGAIVFRYEWTQSSVEWRLEFPIPWSLYQMYRGRLRTPLVDNYDYGAYVEDPLDDPTLEDLAALLAACAPGDEVSYAQCALAFVQGTIRYQADPPELEWPLYPIETLVDREGDCEDTAILFVSLLRARGVSCLLAFIDTGDDGLPDHVLALVEVPDAFADRPGVKVIERDEKRYAVAETAAGALSLGLDPWGLEADDLIQIWAF